MRILKIIDETEVRNIIDEELKRKNKIVSKTELKVLIDIAINKYYAVMDRELKKIKNRLNNLEDNK